MRRGHGLEGVVWEAPHYTREAGKVAIAGLIGSEAITAVVAANDLIALAFSTRYCGPSGFAVPKTYRSSATMTCP